MRRAADVLGRLYAEYHSINERHFAGLLPPLRIELRGLTRPGAKRQTLAATGHDDLGHPRAIGVDEAFALSTLNDWSEVRSLLLHETVHVWQAVRGETETHGPEFRRMAKRLGISARAVD